MSYIHIIKIAFEVFPLIALGITFPYFLIQYHKVGAVNKFKMLCFYLFVFYCLCAYFLVILPLPSIDSVRKLTTPYIQLIPFSFIADFFRESGIVLSDPSTYLTALKSRELLQPIFNLIMLVPLGMFCRYLFNVKKSTIIKIGLYTTLFFELTQLSGLYGIYPRPYRLFDIDDIMLNFSGCIIGYYLLPLFKFIPNLSEVEYKTYKKIDHVSLTRRICAFILDFIIISIIQTIIGMIFSDIIDDPSIMMNIVFILYFLVFILATNGYTPGKKFVGIKLISDNKKIKLWQLVVRYLLIILVYLIIPMLIGIAVFAIILLINNFMDVSLLTDNYIKIFNYQFTYDIILSCLALFLAELIYLLILIKSLIFKRTKEKRLLYERLSKTEEINVTKYKKGLTKV